VLRPDGTLWLNVADSSHGSWGNYGARRGKQRQRTSKRWTRPAYEGQHGYKALPPTARPGGPWKAKDQASIPELLKLAAQYEGWICRSTVVWAKTNPGPESVKDRPTNVHEFIYLFAKCKRYYYDRIAIQEPTKAHSRARAARRERLIARTGQGDEGKLWQQVAHGDGEATLAVAGIVAGRSGGGVGAMRNKWSVWSGPTANASSGHFAVFPEWLARTMLLAGSPPQVCATCRAPFERVTLKERGPATWNQVGHNGLRGAGHYRAHPGGPANRAGRNLNETTYERTVGWRPTCACHVDLLPRARNARKRQRQDARDDWRARASASTQARRFGWPTAPALVLDLFAGSGTTGKVALELGRHPALLDVSRSYLAEFAAPRTAAVQMELFDVEVCHQGLVEYTEHRSNGRRGRKSELTEQSRAGGTQSRVDGVQHRMSLEVGARSENE
jgi:DNA modification methylase